MPRGGVDQLVDMRQREGVLWAGLVEVCEVYADSPVPVLMRQHWLATLGIALHE